MNCGDYYEIPTPIEKEKKNTWLSNNPETTKK